ncbi:MAG: hypothetical protein WCT18_00550 [Patescibacteria group bacterium]
MKQEILDLYNSAMAEEDEAKKQEMLSDLSDLMQDNGAVIFDYELKGKNKVLLSCPRENVSITISLSELLKTLKDPSYFIFSRIDRKMTNQLSHLSGMVILGDLVFACDKKIEAGYFQIKAKNRRKTVNQLLVEARMLDLLEIEKVSLLRRVDKIEKEKDSRSQELLESFLAKDYPLIGWLVDDAFVSAKIRSVSPQGAFAEGSFTVEKIVSWEIFWKKIKKVQCLPNALATLSMFEYLVNLGLLKLEDQGFILVHNEVTVCLRINGIFGTIVLTFADKSKIENLVFKKEEIWQ